MMTFQTLFDAYIKTNPSQLRKSEMDIIKRCGPSFRFIEREIYEQIPREVLDMIVDSKPTDFARTKAAFMIRELDRFAASKEGKNKINHTKLTQREAIKFVLTNNQAFKDEKMRMIALRTGGKEKFTLGYHIVFILIDQEGKTSRSQFIRFRLAALVLEPLYKTPLNEVRKTDLNEVLSKCSKRTTSICNKLLNFIYLQPLGWKEAMNE